MESQNKINSHIFDQNIEEIYDLCGIKDDIETLENIDNVKLNKKLKTNNIKNIHFIFINACRDGNLNDIEYILSNFNIDVNIGIVAACQSGNIEIVKILLKKGADPNYIDKTQKNWSPIIAAYIGNNWDNKNQNEIINELVKYGCNIDFGVFDYVNVYKSRINTIKTSNYSDINVLKYIF